MPTYCGVDFHSRQQKVVYGNTADGEIKRIELKHQTDEVRRFYQQLPLSPGCQAWQAKS